MRYEISAATKGFESETLKLDLKPGPNAKVKLTLQSPTGQSQRTIINSLESETTANSSVRDERPYDEIYPPVPGRDIAERTCLICHGENDRQIPVAYAYRSYEQAVNSPQRELRIFTPAEGATEHIGLDHLDHVSTFIADWVADAFTDLSSMTRK